MALTIRPAQAIAIIGFLGAAIACFLPWVKVGLLSGNTGIDGGDGYIVLVAVVFGIVMLITPSSNSSNAAAVVALLAAVVVLGVGLIDLGDAQNRINAAGLLGVKATVGPGLVLVLISGVVAAIGSFGSLSGHDETNAEHAAAPVAEPQIGKCSSCGGQVSTEADACPWCGIVFAAPPETVP